MFMFMKLSAVKAIEFPNTVQRILLADLAKLPPVASAGVFFSWIHSMSHGGKMFLYHQQVSHCGACLLLAKITTCTVTL
jgi:hypothetical protein